MSDKPEKTQKNNEYGRATGVVVSGPTEIENGVTYKVKTLNEKEITLGVYSAKKNFEAMKAEMDALVASGATKKFEGTKLFGKTGYTLAVNKVSEPDVKNELEAGAEGGKAKGKSKAADPNKPKLANFPVEVGAFKVGEKLSVGDAIHEVTELGRAFKIEDEEAAKKMAERFPGATIEVGKEYQYAKFPAPADAENTPTPA